MLVSPFFGVFRPSFLSFPFFFLIVTEKKLKHEKDVCVQQAAWEAPVCWLKYTTVLIVCVAVNQVYACFLKCKNWKKAVIIQAEELSW